ncbi:fructose 1,6-bisphosphatase [Flavobacterium faecale]|uniref:Fructose 1,6-bisphosphatase n=1 Tax=Flavobacterium faecale TaxID=1355330 RepID=A0A2S1LBL9_9FLAO|nr:fructose 1,6-bisphosphatase [Flavobacterium faecale]AWG21114.1 fructose 1,6-bisphosphatase [Flavobacterium faecale]
MENHENNQPESPISDPNESQKRLEAIKNLIFGENIEQINTDFEDLKKLINKRKEELESYIEDVNKNLTILIDDVSTDLNIRVSTLEENLNEKIDTLNHNKVDRNVLGKLLVNMGEKIMKD